MSKIYTWKTNKVKNGYSFTVSEMKPRVTQNKKGQYVDTKVIKKGILPTRARSKNMATRWIRFFKAKKS